MAQDRPTRLLYGGYRYIRVPFGYPNAHQKRGMSGAAYIQEHVYKAQEALGRPLGKDEYVHHFNLNKLDNRNENLMICSNSYHRWLHERMGLAWAQEHLQGAPA